MSENLENLRYPIGRFEPPSRIDRDQLKRWIGDMEALPADLRRSVKGLTDIQLHTPYRPGDRTIRQVIHHLLASHISTLLQVTSRKPEDETNLAPSRPP